jgi:hypothetical protein
MPASVIESTISNAVVVRLGVTDPPLTDAISQNNRVVEDLQEVFFYMRPLLSRTPVINGATGSVINPADQFGNNVSYQWADEDVATEGEYSGWWQFTRSSVDSGGSQEASPEFPIIITDHGPGLRVPTGAILDGVADHMPTTFAALRDDPRFGDRYLQRYATLIQIKVMGQAVEPDNEITQYALPLLDYFSKRVAHALCTPAIDYWGRQRKTITAQSPVEVTAYPDMIQALELLRDRLHRELIEDWRQLRYDVPGLPNRKVEVLPMSDMNWRDDRGFMHAIPPKTKDPYLMPNLLTGVWGVWEFTLGLFPDTRFYP